MSCFGARGSTQSAGCSRDHQGASPLAGRDQDLAPALFHCIGELLGWLINCKVGHITALQTNGFWSTTILEEKSLHTNYLLLVPPNKPLLTGERGNCYASSLRKREIQQISEVLSSINSSKGPFLKNDLL